jgi:hypothetical protein
VDTKRASLLEVHYFRVFGLIVPWFFGRLPVLHFAQWREIDMDPYRIAYEQAMTELNEITRKFDLLRLQKAQVENLINAFRPLIESSDQTANAIAG